MRARASVAAIVTACALTAGVAYGSGGPSAVYNDYAADGVLSCNHSRADLEAVLRSGSLNQYGDPYTLARLKLAVRKELAGGCREKSGAGQNRTGGTGASRAGGTKSGQKSSQSGPGHPRRTGGSNQASPSQAAPGRRAAAGGSNASFVAGRGLIVGLLVAALAFGGWLTKHALAARD